MVLIIAVIITYNKMRKSEVCFPADAFVQFNSELKQRKRDPRYASDAVVRQTKPLLWRFTGPRSLFFFFSFKHCRRANLFCFACTIQLCTSDLT